jgi:sugar O-acyltransferase (sialic acid O-acetyltransferase NeuD family)
MKDIIVVGASSFGRELAELVLDVAARQSQIRLKGFLDDNPNLKAELGRVLGVEVLGDTQGYSIQENDRFLISPGDPELRKLLAERIAERGGKFFTLIHPTAYLASTATLGAGCIMRAFATVGSSARLGEHVLLSSYATAGHDTQIGSYSMFSPYAIACGGCAIEERVFFGTHAVVTPNHKVGRQSKIAAGAVVYRNVPELSLAAGNPAKILPISTARNDS